MNLASLPQSPLNDPPEIIDRERAYLKHRRKQVCIYANGLGKDKAPLDDPAWEVWALNLVAPMDTEGRLRADLWFDLHERAAQTASDLDWMANCPVPIVVPDDLMDIGDHTVRFPIEVLVDHYPEAPYACTFAYQIAWAILQGFKTIGLYGVELAFGDEREATVEWASVNWWIGYAEAVGIEILRPDKTRLGRHSHLYGFDYQAEKDATSRYVSLRKTITARMDD